MSTGEDHTCAIRDILDGEAPYNAEGWETRPLAALASTPTPTLPDTVRNAGTVVSLSCVAAALVMAVTSLLGNHLLNVLALVALASAVAIFVLSSRRSLHLVLGHAERLNIALQELRDCHDDLKTYITNLDNRTRRYFHCVTNTKISSYCALLQIVSTLQEKIAYAEALRAEESREAVIELDELLRGTLEFRDGIVKGSGQQYSVPLWRLHITAHELCSYLDSELSLLEQEIAHEWEETEQAVARAKEGTVRKGTIIR